MSSVDESNADTVTSESVSEGLQIETSEYIPSNVDDSSEIPTSQQDPSTETPNINDTEEVSSEIPTEESETIRKELEVATTEVFEVTEDVSKIKEADLEQDAKQLQEPDTENIPEATELEIQQNQKMDLEDTPIEEENREQPTEGEENRPTEQLEANQPESEEAPPHNQESDKTGEANKQQESDQESPNEPPRKKRNIDVDKLTIIDPSEFKMSNNTKRITGKFIDKFWQPLDDVNAKSFDNILNLALSKTLKRLGSLDSEGNMNEKMKLANKILTNAWLNPSNLESFKSRLRVTKVPLPSTMFPNNKGTIKDVFNYDKVLERKQFLETCLSAELKQLQDLEKYYHETKMIYESDKKYLSELTRATNGKEAKLRHQMYTQREELGLDEEIKPDVDLNLATPGTLSSSFNPDKDEEIKPILESLQKHLETISANTEPMLVFNEELEMLLNMLS